MADSQQSKPVFSPYQSTRLNRYDAVPKPGDEHEAAEIHLISWWGGGFMADNRMVAAIPDAGNRVCEQQGG